MTEPTLPVGKIPQELLAKLIASVPALGDRVVLGPGIGLDCAVLEFGDACLVLKTEPITFASQEIGWYAVQIAVNDVVTSGARPKWMLLTSLLPENKTTPALIAEIGNQVADSCRKAGISLIGGHTEITYGIDRPILVTTMIGEVSAEELITPKGIIDGDLLILTKGVPVEATALLAREFPAQLEQILTPDEIRCAQDYLYSPGISVMHDALLAASCGGVHAMHDPTEGGVATALWEMAIASETCLQVDLTAVPISAVSAKICAAFHLDPLGVISSGALLLACQPQKSAEILEKLSQNGIPAAIIGTAIPGPAGMVITSTQPWSELKKFPRDEITRVYEKS